MVETGNLETDFFGQTLENSRAVREPRGIISKKEPFFEMPLNIFR